MNAEPQSHPSSSAEQLAAEHAVLEVLSTRYGPLNGAEIELPGGAVVAVDGVTHDRSVFVEVFAHVGRLKGGQIKKVAADAFKLVTIARVFPSATLVLAFVDDAAARTARAEKSWLGQAIATWGIRVDVVELEEETRGQIVIAQTRQVMVNPPPA